MELPHCEKLFTVVLYFKHNVSLLKTFYIDKLNKVMLALRRYTNLQTYLVTNFECMRIQKTIKLSA